MREDSEASQSRPPISGSTAVSLGVVLALGGGLVGYGATITRVSSLDAAFTAHVLRADELQQRRDTEVQLVRDSITQVKLDTSERLTRMESGIDGLKQTVAHIDGLLGGDVRTAKGRGR